jgi:pimeloyl-ACP methyl ester carboxylesterase
VADDPKNSLNPVGDCLGYGAVVFVHGLRGHHEGTWEDFPRLLAEDPALPHVDVYSWAYETGVFRKGTSIEDEARRFMSGLEVGLEAGPELHLVGHSQGGLVILRGLIQRLEGGTVPSHPVTNVRVVLLYASPVAGSPWANRLRDLLGLVLLGSPQLKGLAEGPFCDRLVEDVNTRLAGLPVTLRVAVGDRDWVVPEDSATAVAKVTVPITLSGTHSSVKMPTSRVDLRYKAFQSQLGRFYGAWLRERIAAARRGDWIARVELRERCERAIREHCRDHPRLGERLAKDEGALIDDVLWSAANYLEERPDSSFGRALVIAVRAHGRGIV